MLTHMRAYPVWEIRRQDDYGTVIDTLLEGRGVSLEDLDVGPEVMHSPSLMTDVDKAVERLARAVRGGERMVVFGDYDVDGVTSTALLLESLQQVGGDAQYLLPDRHQDGYGLKPPGVERALKMGADLIVTVDNGMSAFEALELAAARNVDVVVVDHHRQLGDLPRAVAIVNPNRDDCSYPFPDLAGVGVAFKVVQALCEELMESGQRRRFLNDLLDLVALGTVADMMPVLGENRLYIQRGLQVLSRTQRPGLRQLLLAAGYANKPVDAAAVAFHLGPRLNVAGRLETPDLALRLLMTRDDGEGAGLAQELNALNSRRQVLQRAGAAEAEALVSSQILQEETMIILLGESWHLGVIGLLASRLSEKHARPAVVCTAQRQDGTYTGSARSIPAYDISAGVSTCGDLLLNYGGHPGAAGFTLPQEAFEEFRVRLLEHARTRLSEADLQPTLEIDLLLRPQDVSSGTLNSLRQLEPFGQGNPAPLFCARGCHITRARAIGKGGDHLKVELRHGDTRCGGVWWNKGQYTGALHSGARVDVAFSLQADTYSGGNAVQMILQDMYLS
jgi:single-stranded-DNA-specific exonuclease